MKRFVKIITSRFGISAICILLEFAGIVSLLLAINVLSPEILALSYIFDVFVFFYIVNKDETPEFKLPWIVAILLIPVVGALLYILFGKVNLSKRQQRRFRDAMEKAQPFCEQNPQILALRAENEEAYLQAACINALADMPYANHTAATYFPLGERFWEALLEDLRRAEHFIFMEYFIIQPGKMWDAILQLLKEKAQAGVQVYLTYDDFGCMRTLPERYYLELCRSGIHCFPACRIRPILSAIHNNRDHRKITVIDGTIGYTGGINLADEYINAVVRFGHWKDSAIRLEGPAVRNLTLMFLISWNDQNEVPLPYECYMNVPVPELPCRGAAIPFGDGPKPSYTEQIGEAVYLNMINAAKDYLYITTPYLICDHTLLTALELAARKGVDVRMITPHIPDKKLIFLMTRSNYQPLLRAGVKIYEYTPGFIHAKNFICDDQFAICGTINLDYRSLVHHYECGVWMYALDCISDMKNDFLKTQALSEEVTDRHAVLNPLQRPIVHVLKVFFPLF